MALSTMTHNELIRILAQSPRDEMAWGEFYKRFHRHISLAVAREAGRWRHGDRQNTVEDLVQEVYAKLLANDCQALKEFKGQYEHSIFSYLEIIAIRTVLADRAKSTAQKRSSGKGKISLDAKQWDAGQETVIDLKQMLRWEGWESDLLLRELQEEIEYHLFGILKKRRNQERDGLIFRGYVYEELEAEEIVALCGDPQLTAKRVLNIAGEIKQELAKRLRGSVVAK